MITYNELRRCFSPFNVIFKYVSNPKLDEEFLHTGNLANRNERRVFFNIHSVGFISKPKYFFSPVLRVEFAAEKGGVVFSHGPSAHELPVLFRGYIGVMNSSSVLELNCHGV